MLSLNKYTRKISLNGKYCAEHSLVHTLFLGKSIQCTPSAFSQKNSWCTLESRPRVSKNDTKFKEIIEYIEINYDREYWEEQEMLI